MSKIWTTQKWRGNGVIFPYMDVARPFSRRLRRRVVYLNLSNYPVDKDEAKDVECSPVLCLNLKYYTQKIECKFVIGYNCNVMHNAFTREKLKKYE